MKLKRSVFNRNGTVLIFALWALGILSILAFQIGLNARQKITLLSRIEKRTQLENIASAGINVAISLLNKDFEKNKFQLTPVNKQMRHNSKGEYGEIIIGRGTAEVSCLTLDEEGAISKRFGLIDEESKLNLNYANFEELTRLVEYVLGYPLREAQEFAQAVIDWRVYGGKELAGFLSDDYYDDLKYSYSPKRSLFEAPEELLLIRGVDLDGYTKLSKFVTVFGDGRINFNTASQPVFYALGFDESLIRKILLTRRGGDGLEATPDDFIFDRTSRFADTLKRYVNLEQYEVNQIDQVNSEKKLKTSSTHFMIQSTGKLANTEQSKVIRCVYDVDKKMIENWREFN